MCTLYDKNSLTALGRLMAHMDCTTVKHSVPTLWAPLWPALTHCTGKSCCQHAVNPFWVEVKKWHFCMKETWHKISFIIVLHSWPVQFRIIGCYRFDSATVSEKALSALEFFMFIPSIYSVAFWLCGHFFLVTGVSNMYHACFNIIDEDFIDRDFRFTDYFCSSVLSATFSKTPFFSWFRQCLLKIKTSRCWEHFQD